MNLNRYLKEIVILVLSLYSFVLIIPLIMLMIFMISFIIGFEPKVTYFEFLQTYFYDGHFRGIDVEAWRIHVCILFLLLIISTINTLERL